MIERDDEISRRYRELPREEPPTALDAAIRAQAHRAAARPRSRSHWMGAVSIAAVLVLALGITLRLQHEEPGIETAPVPAVAAPRTEADPPAAPEATPAPVAPQPQPPQAAKPARARPAEKPSAAPQPVEKRSLAPQAVTEPPKPFAADVAPAAAATTPPAVASPAAPATTPPTAASAVRETSITAPRAERSNLGVPAGAAAPTSQKRAAAKQDASSDTERDAQLERIAALREAGKVAEADEALTRFRERWPDYPIPDALWQRVRPR